MNLLFLFKNAGFYSGLIHINTSYDFHTLADGNTPAPDKYDLYSVALHEAFHLLVFSI
ncbi:MAG: hypothetical protein ACI9XO_003308 [Paraglaciecola sp.]|jgi:hypothetical protein